MLEKIKYITDKGYYVISSNIFTEMIIYPFSESLLDRCGCICWERPEYKEPCLDDDLPTVFTPFNLPVICCGNVAVALVME